VELAEIVSIYLRHFESKREEDWWACEQVDSLVDKEPEQGWEITLMLVNKSPSDEALAYVAAGPLENLLIKHGPEVIDRIEKESSTNERLQLALSGVWMRREDSAFERWFALMNKYGFADGSRMAL
jgi:hypothetical protein